MAARNEQQQIVINANYELFVVGLVLLSMINNLVVLFPIEQQARDLIGIVEFCITGFLLCDFLYRVLSTRRKRDYLITYYGWLDFVGSLPFAGARLARLIRLAILGRKLRRSDLLAMGEVVIARPAQSALLGVVLLVIIVLELGGLSVLKVEAGAPNANITTASDALWWGAVTVATVGYGDRYPVTDLGRIVGVLVMTVGLGLFSVLISFLADWFRRPRRVRRVAAAPPADPRAHLREVMRLLEAQAAAHEHSLRVLADLRAQLADIEQALAERERGDRVDVEPSESLSEERHMTDNQNIHAVIAIFAGKAAAEQAIDALKRWDRASAEIKLGAIGTIAKEGDKVTTHVGRMTGRGTTVGALIGVIAAVLSGGLTIVGGVVRGAALGGMIGAFMKRSLNLTESEIQAIGAELDAGKVAVVVTCDAYEIEGTAAQLSGAGGAVRTYTMLQEALAEVDQAVTAAESPPAPPAGGPGGER